MQNLPQSSSLSLAIQQHHDAAQECAGEAVTHARKAGEFLNSAKAEVGHGNWLPWFEAAGFTFAERTAQAYMRLAKEWPGLSKEKRNTVADLSLRDAMKTLAKPAKADKPVDAVKAIISEPSKPKVDADEKHAGQWSKRDEETYAALLDAWAAASERAKAEFRKYIATDCGDLPQQIRDAMRALIDMGAADAVRSVVLYGAGLPEVKAGVHVPRKKAARKSSKAKPARGTMVRGTDPKTGEPMIGVNIPGIFS